MRFLEVVLLIGLIFNGVFGMQLQWDVHHGRKLLLPAGGKPVTGKEKQLFKISAGPKTYTGVVLKNKLIAVPGKVKDAKIGDKALVLKPGTKGTTFTFFTYADAGKEYADYYEPGGAIGECGIVGFDDGGKMASVPVVVANLSADPIKFEVKLCESDAGAGLVCGNKLSGIVNAAATTDAAAPPEEGGGDVKLTTPTSTSKKGGRGAEEAREASEVPAAGGGPSTGSSSGASGASGASSTPSSSTTSKKARRKRADEGSAGGGNPKDSGSAGAAKPEGGGKPPAAGGCDLALTATPIDKINEMASKAGFGSVYRKFAATGPVIVALALVACFA